MVEKDWTDPRVGRSRVRERDTSAAMPHAKMPPTTERPERAALALWARPAHASSMAASTTDDNLAVHDDANSLRSGKHKTPAMAPQATGHEQTGVGGTQISTSVDATES